MGMNSINIEIWEFWVMYDYEKRISYMKTFTTSPQFPIPFFIKPCSTTTH